MKQKILFLFVIGMLGFSLSACGNRGENTSLEQNDHMDEVVEERESETTEEYEVENQPEEYRKFDFETFCIDSEYGSLMLFDGESSNNADLADNMLHRYYDGVIDEYSSSQDSQEKQLEFVTKYIIKDALGASSDDVSLDFVSYEKYGQDDFLYFKVNLKNGGNSLNSSFSNYRAGDEVYLAVKGGLGTVPSGQYAVRLSYFIKNYSLLSDDSDEADNSSATADELTLNTEYFSVVFPENWYGKYDVDFYSDEQIKDWSIVLKEEITNNSDMGYLFSVVMVRDGESYYDYPEYDYYACAEYEDDGKYNVIITYPSDVQFDDAYEYIYRDLQEDIPNVIDGLKLKTSNVSFEESDNAGENNNVAELMSKNGEIDEDGIPFVAFWGNTLNEYYTGRTDSQMWRSSIVDPFALYQIGGMKCYYNIDDDSYYGVDEDGKIVSHSYNWFGTNEILMKNFWDSRYEWVEPKVESYGDMDYCIWKIANGYLVVTAIAYDNPYESWGDKRVYAYSVMTDKKYCAPFREKKKQ